MAFFYPLKGENNFQKRTARQSNPCHLYPCVVSSGDIQKVSDTRFSSSEIDS